MAPSKYIPNSPPVLDDHDAARLAMWPELVAAIERMIRRDELTGTGKLCKTPAHEDAVKVLARARALSACQPDDARRVAAAASLSDADLSRVATDLEPMQ